MSIREDRPYGATQRPRDPRRDTPRLLPLPPPRTSQSRCPCPRPGCIRQHPSASVSIRQHPSAYVSIRQHPSASVSIRQHMPHLPMLAPCNARHLLCKSDTYDHSWTPGMSVSIRQHTSVYVSIRQHTRTSWTRRISVRQAS